MGLGRNKTEIKCKKKKNEWLNRVIKNNGDRGVLQKKEVTRTCKHLLGTEPTVYFGNVGISLSER